MENNVEKPMQSPEIRGTARLALTAIIARLEIAKSPRRDLDEQIAAAFGIKWSADEDGQFGGYGIMPRRVRFTESIDAAMTLVDLAGGWIPFIECEHRFNGIVWEVQLGHAVHEATDHTFHTSLPIAICIAAINARALVGA